MLKPMETTRQLMVALPGKLLSVMNRLLLHFGREQALCGLVQRAIHDQSTAVDYVDGAMD
jgi:hypothetical protein